MTTVFLGAARTDASLLADMRKPNAELPWERFVATYDHLIASWVRKSGLREEDARDIVAEVYLRLVPRLRDFVYDPERKFRGWLRCVVRSTIADSYRRQVKQVGRATGDDTLARIPAPEADTQVPETLGKALDRDLTRRMRIARGVVRKVKGQVEPTSWKAFEWTYLRGIPIDEAARRLKVQRGAIYVARCRVRALLQKEAASQPLP